MAPSNTLATANAASAAAEPSSPVSASSGAAGSIAAGASTNEATKNDSVYTKSLAPVLTLPENSAAVAKSPRSTLHSCAAYSSR